MSLLLVGGATFALAGCFPDRRDSVLFDTPDQCEAGSSNSQAFWNADDCTEAFEVAQAEHALSAPRYDSLQVCEEQHGVGNCGGEDATGSAAAATTAGTGGGGIFLPLMAGYMMGNMMSSGAQSGFASRALYPTAGGAVATANGTSFARTGVITSTAASTFTRPAAITAGQPPMTRATVARTGGFGGSMSVAGG